MNKLKQKIMETDFGKLLKRWLILAICVLVAGGGFPLSCSARRFGKRLQHQRRRSGPVIRLPGSPAAQRNRVIRNSPTAAEAGTASAAAEGNAEAAQGAAVQTDWRARFADKFTDRVVSTDTSYTSPDLSVTITRNSYDTGRLDHSENSRHKAYILYVIRKILAHVSIVCSISILIMMVLDYYNPLMDFIGHAGAVLILLCGCTLFLQIFCLLIHGRRRA